MSAADVLAQVAGELRKECSCVVGGPNHGQCLNCDLSDRIETASAALAELIEAEDELDAAESAWGDATHAGDWDAIYSGRERFSAAVKRRYAALARCKGESP